MEKKEGSATIVIGKKAFISSVAILLVLTLIAGILTQVIPQGHYQRVKTIDGETIIPDSFSYAKDKPLPIYHWFIGWIEVLFDSGSLIVISIIVFILIIGTCFAIIDKTNVLQNVIEILTEKFEKNKFILISIITLFFMLIGSMFGIFEEMIPLIPLILILSKNFGWDELMALGMSLLATGFGFAAAISNPFTLGVAQRLANIPVFSGAALRVLIFIVVYIILIAFLELYLKRLSRKQNNMNIKPDFGNIYKTKKTDETKDDNKNNNKNNNNLNDKNRIMKKSVFFFVFMIILMFIFIVLTLFIKEISGLSLPFIAIVFITITIGTSIIQKIKTKEVLKTALKGFLGIAPAIVLILLAMGVNFIIRKGNIIDTILFFASNQMKKAGSYGTALGIYLITLFLNFFIGSASAKAFLLMPILTPLADITGISRQIAVLAFQFGDGFSNVIYPTNPVLLIGLAISGIAYPKWLKFTIVLQISILIVTALFLCLAVAVGYN